MNPQYGIDSILFRFLFRFLSDIRINALNFTKKTEKKRVAINFTIFLDSMKSMRTTLMICIFIFSFSLPCRARSINL